MSRCANPLSQSDVYLRPFQAANECLLIIKNQTRYPLSIRLPTDRESFVPLTTKTSDNG